ncbi:MAG TPA: hypothetical protein VFH97_09525 [Gemmatimonadales bacterium]|nr:hypothetical protein [Gemmatimonadales bacterium]
MRVPPLLRPLAAFGVLMAGAAGLALGLAPAGAAMRAGLPAPGEPRVLCGLGGGCDTVVRVESVRQSVTAGRAPDRVPADGVFYVVTAEVRAAGGTGPPSAVEARVRDARGRTYGRALDVEARLPPAPPGRVRWVFDLPDRVPAPRLLLQRPGLLNRLARSVEIPLASPEI